MSSDIEIMMIGAWLHQLLRAAAVLCRIPRSLSRPERLVIMGFAPVDAAAADGDDHSAIRQVIADFIREVYFFLLVPMCIAIASLFLF